MTGTTTDPDDPRLTRGIDHTPRPQADVYLVDDGTGEYVRPVRRAYTHVLGCGTTTRMSVGLAETYARDPSFYGATYCVKCCMHRALYEFEWVPEPGETIPEEHRRVGT